MSWRKRCFHRTPKLDMDRFKLSGRFFGNGHSRHFLASLKTKYSYNMLNLERDMRGLNLLLNKRTHFRFLPRNDCTDFSETWLERSTCASTNTLVSFSVMTSLLKKGIEIEIRKLLIVLFLHLLYKLFLERIKLLIFL